MPSQSTPIPLTMTIPLTRGYEVIIDVADYERVAPYRWVALVAKGGRYVYAIGYVRGTAVYVNRKRVDPGLTILMHRLILSLPRGEGVGDHINGDTLDNRRSNLRVVDTAGNARNNITARLKDENAYLKSVLVQHNIRF